MFKKILVLVGLFALFALAPVLVGAVSGSNMEPKVGHISIQAHNVYNLDVTAEIKCNFNNIKKEYKFYKIITVPGKSNTIINVPNNVTECELWPSVRWF